MDREFMHRMKLITRIFRSRTNRLGIDLETIDGRIASHEIWSDTKRDIDRILGERRGRRARLNDGARLAEMLETANGL